MKILFASTEGNGADIALRLKLEGHQVRLWIKDPEDRRDTFDGLLDKVQNWQGSLYWSDLVICDHVGLVEVYTAAERIKKPVFGGSPFADRIEQDRPFGHRIMAEAGLKKNEVLSFKTVVDAIAHLKQHQVRHVVKPIGKKVMSHHIILSEQDDGSDAVALLEHFQAQRIPFDQLEVEEFIVGIECACTGWFNGKEYLDVNVNFEEKKLATGGLGPLTGEMGETMKHVELTNVFFERTLAKVAPILKRERYRGIIDLAFILKEDGSGEVPTEFTARPGYPPIFIMASLLEGKLGEMFMATARGSAAQAQASRDWGVAVVMITPGFPSRKEVELRSIGTPIFGVDPLKPGQVHLVEATSRPRLQTTDGHGYPAVITGRGTALKAARSDAYSKLDRNNKDRIYIPNAWWRTDIGDRVERKLDVLRKFGVIGARDA